jgi:hypothetical protein
VLHLSEHHGDAIPGAARYYKPGIEDMPWNARVIQIIDPFGNKLRFSEPK